MGICRRAVLSGLAPRRWIAAGGGVAEHSDYFGESHRVRLNRWTWSMICRCEGCGSRNVKFREREARLNLPGWVEHQHDCGICSIWSGLYEKPLSAFSGAHKVSDTVMACSILQKFIVIRVHVIIKRCHIRDLFIQVPYLPMHCLLKALNH